MFGIKIILIIVVYHVLREEVVDGVPVRDREDSKIVDEYGGDYSSSDEDANVNRDDVGERENNSGKPGEVSFLGSRHVLNCAVSQDWRVFPPRQCDHSTPPLPNPMGEARRGLKPKAGMRLEGKMEVMIRERSGMKRVYRS